MKEVGIPGLNLHRFWQFYFFVFFVFTDHFDKLYRTLERVFHQVSKHLEMGLKKLGCASFFNLPLGVWIS